MAFPGARPGLPDGLEDVSHAIIFLFREQFVLKNHKMCNIIDILVLYELILQYQSKNLLIARTNISSVVKVLRY